MKEILLTLCLWVVVAYTPLFAQSKLNLDSMLTVINQYPKDDTVKVKLMITLSDALTRVNAKEGIAYSERALAIAENFKDIELKADALFVKAQHLKDQYKRTETLDLAKQALSIYESLQRIKKMADANNLIGRIYDNKGDFDNGKMHFESAIALSEQIGYTKVKIAALNGLGVIYIGVDDNIAVKYNEQAIQLAQKQGDLKGEALALGSVGLCHYRLGNYTKAVETLQKALRLNENIKNDYDRAYNYRSLGHVYVKFSEYEKGLDCYKKSLEIAQKTDNENIQGSIYGLIGNTYKLLKRYDEAIMNIEKGIDLNKKMGTYVPLRFLASTYEAAGREIEAHRCYQEALATAKKSNKLAETATNAICIGQLYVKVSDSLLILMGVSPSERYTKAETFATEGLELGKKMDAKQNIVDALGVLSTIHERNKAYLKAYTTYKEHILLKDSIKGDEVKKQITRKEIQYEFDKKEAALQFEQQLTIEQLEQQKLLSIQQRQALTLSDKEKELQRLAYLKEKAEKQEKEQLLSLAEKDKQLQAADIISLAKEKALQLENIARKNAVIGFLIAGLAAFLLAFIAFYQWIRGRQAQKEAIIQTQFTQNLLENIEEERGRIAVDLHDSVSHELLSLKRNLTHTPDISSKIDGIIDDIRQISRNLHPVMLDKIGLQLSLETLCEQFMQNENIFVAQDIQYRNSLTQSAELQLFRIVQEALTNAHKYAGAEAVQVQLIDKEGQLSLQIRDNGRGFDVDKALSSGKAFGLHSMIQRSKAIGGKLEIQSSGSGSVICLRIQVPDR